jgi:hypothetical protein
MKSGSMDSYPSALSGTGADIGGEPDDFNNAIPGAAWREYDAAADWCAARGIRGAIKDPLPENLSDRAMELINIDPEAFERRVREHAYFRSMSGNRPVSIIKSGESHTA